MFILYFTYLLYIFVALNRDEQANILLTRNHSLFTLQPNPILPRNWLINIPIVIDILYNICCHTPYAFSLSGFILNILHSIGYIYIICI